MDPNPRGDMITLAKLVFSFVVSLTYPPTENGMETFAMDIVCNMSEDCEITINRDETHYSKKE